MKTSDGKGGGRGGGRKEATQQNLIWTLCGLIFFFSALLLLSRMLQIRQRPKGELGEKKEPPPPTKCTRMHICKTSHQGPNKVWRRRKCSELKRAREKRRQEKVICGLFFLFFFNRDGFNYVGPKQTLHTNQGLLLQGHLRWPSRQIGSCHERIQPANTHRCTLRYVQIMMTPRASPREDRNLCTLAAFDEASIKFQRTSKRSINQNQWPTFGGGVRDDWVLSVWAQQCCHSSANQDFY